MDTDDITNESEIQKIQNLGFKWYNPLKSLY